MVSSNTYLHRKCNPLEACFAPAASSGRCSVLRIGAANGFLPRASMKLESLPYLPPARSSSCASIMFGMRNLLLSFSGVFAGVLRSTPAHIAEHFCQLLAPAVETSLWGDVTAVQGIGIRLARDGRTKPNNDNVLTRSQRLNQLHGISDLALQFLRFHRGWP